MFKGIFFILVFYQVNSLTTENMKSSLSSRLYTDDFYKDIFSNPTHTLVVKGTASTSLESDLIKVGIKIETLDNHPYVAYQNNTNVANRIEEVFKNMKIQKKNVTTKDYRIFKEYESIYVPMNETWVSVFQGYKVINEMEVVLTNLKDVGNLIDNVVVGDDPVLITSVDFSFSPELSKKTSDSLLAVASKDAIERSAILAKSLNVIIQDIKSISVNQQTPHYSSRSILRKSYRSAHSLDTLAVAQEAPSIYRGTDIISMNIDVTYLIIKDDMY